jgi:hypothetical protein
LTLNTTFAKAALPPSTCRRSTYHTVIPPHRNTKHTRYRRIPIHDLTNTHSNAAPSNDFPPSTKMLPSFASRPNATHLPSSCILDFDHAAGASKPFFFTFL